MNEGSHISLVDIKIPEEVTKNFTFTGHQAISGEPSKDNQPKLMAFPKGVYNIHKLQDKVNNNPQNKNFRLNIGTTNNNICILQRNLIQLEFHQNQHKY